MTARHKVVLPVVLLAALAAGQVTVQRNLTKTKVTNATLQRAVIPVAEAGRQAADQARSLDGKGPGEGLLLSDVVRIEQLERFGLEMSDLCRLSLEVYEDTNPASGIYYYRPSRYMLRFEPGEGYFLSVDYKAGAESGKNVLIQARLTPGAGPADLEILRALLRRHTQGHGPKPTLLRLPATYEAHFDLSAFGVDAVNVSGVDTDTGEVVINFTTGVETKELLTSTLGNVIGLVGSITLKTAVVSDQQTFRGNVDIKAEIKMADISSGPRLVWRASGPAAKLANAFPFPMVMHNLCYLVQEGTTGELRLRGWSLGDTRLEPLDSARLDPAKLNTEIGTPAVVAAFYDATLVRDEASVRRVVEDLTGGVGALPVHELWVEVVKPQQLFQQYNVYKVAVEVRSQHFDPQGQTSISHTYELDEATAKLQCDPLYLRGSLGPGAYEFRVGIVTTDGTVHTDSTWRQASPALANRIFVGASLIEEVLGK
jgi:hypothetical protein